MLVPSTLAQRCSALSKLIHRPPSELWEAKFYLGQEALLEGTAIFSLWKIRQLGRFWLGSWESSDPFQSISRCPRLQVQSPVSTLPTHMWERVGHTHGFKIPRGQREPQQSSWCPPSGSPWFPQEDANESFHSNSHPSIRRPRNNSGCCSSSPDSMGKAGSIP